MKHHMLSCKINVLRFTFALFSLLASGFAQTALAQAIPQNAYGAMQWRNIGPFRAGRTLAAVGIAGDSGRFYFGGVDGGVWATTSAGQTWQPISDGQVSPSIGALAIAPSNEKIIYAGTGEADMRSDITYGDGVYKSTDGGAHWIYLGLGDSRHIGKILIDPVNPDLVLVAAVGHAYGANRERGVYRTTDGGKTWKNVLYKNPQTGAVDLAWDPQNSKIVYATTWQMRRVPWDQYAPVQGAGSGLYKSTDEGQTWHAILGHGLPAGPLGRIGVAVARGSAGQRVFAIVQAQKEGSGLYRSDDGGANWRLVNNDPRVITRMWYFGRVFLDPQNPDTVYIPSQGLLRSRDGGQHFTVIKSAPGGDDYHYLWIDPANSTHLVLAADQGASVSLDDGRTWSSWYNQPTAQFYHVTTDNRFPYRVYGSQQDSGTVSITSRSDYGEITFRDWHPVGGGESGYIAVDPNNPNLVYSADVYGGLHRFDSATGQFQVISVWPLADFTVPIAQRKYRFGWTPALVFDRHQPDTLYLGAQMLLRSRDGGLHWRAISADLTGARPKAKPGQKALGLDNATARGWGVIFTIAPSPVARDQIWVGTDNGVIQLTRDGGKTWRNVTPAGLPPWSKISLIEASPYQAGVAYAAIDRHRLDDLAPYIYKTIDFGQHWSRADRGINTLAYVHVVRADPKRQGLLYAGTELGVYVSFDDGADWQPLQNNLPTVAVRDLAVHGDDLVAATHGRAFWILDDVTPLRQLTTPALAAPLTLFKPQRAIRIRHSISTDTPLPPEIPHGTNPPWGAIIDYHLKSAPAGPVEVDILDAAGHLVRHFSSTDKAAPPRKPPYFMSAWLPRNQPPTAHAGHNRFVWDLHYTAPPARHESFSMAANAGRGTVKEPRGPLVLPGKYQVRLSVDGQTRSRALRVDMDPRVHVAAQALNEQLRLAGKVWDDLASQNSLDVAVKALQASLQQAQQQQKFGRGAKALVAAIDDKVKTLNVFLDDGGLATLETVVMSADREPAQQMRDAYALMHARLLRAQRQWRDMIRTDLAPLNKRLAAQHRPAMVPAATPSRSLLLPDAEP